MPEPLGNVLPIYFVADESASMANLMEDLNTGLSSLLDALHAEPMAAGRVRFGVIGFSDVAITYLPPMDLRQVETMPTLTARANTSYATAFDALADQITYDVRQLKDQNYSVNRPAVFFLTDGAPDRGDGWQDAHKRLLAIPGAPNILAFGIGSADASVIREVASKPEFAHIAVQSGRDVGESLSKFIVALTQSVIKSGLALGSGQGSLQMERPDGFISLDVEQV